MPAQTQNSMMEEAELAARFSESYRKKFATMIDRLNRGLYGAADRDGLRLCIEAVDMMLATQTHIAKALANLGATTAYPNRDVRADKARL